MNAPSESTVLRRLLTGSAMSLVNMVVVIAIGLVMTPFLLRNIGDRQMGMWMLVGSFTGFYGLLDFGITSAVSRYLTLGFTRNDVKACNSYAGIGFYLFLVIGVVAAAISVVVALIVYLVYNKDVADIGVMAWVIVILGVNFMIDFPLRVFSGIITGCLRHDLNNVRQLVFRILGTGLTFGVVYHGGKIIEMSLAGFFMSILSAISFYWLAKKVFPPLRLSLKSIRREDFKPLFGYSIFTSLAQITDALRFQISGIVIAGFLSVEIIAHYGIAITLATYFQQTMLYCTGWLTNWFTRLEAKGDTEAIRKHALFAIKISVILSNFFAFGLIFWSVPFISRWVGPRFLDAYDPLLLLVFAMTFNGWFSPITRMLYATSKHHYYAIINAVEALLNIAIMLCLISAWGMSGIATGNFVSMFVSRIILIPLVAVFVMGIPAARYWDNFSVTLLKSLACLVLPYIVTNLIVVAEYKWLFLNGLICAAIYFVSVFWIVLTRSEKEKLFRKIVGKS